MVSVTDVLVVGDGSADVEVDAVSLGVKEYEAELEGVSVTLTEMDTDGAAVMDEDLVCVGVIEGDGVGGPTVKVTYTSLKLGPSHLRPTVEPMSM